jgi:phage baseplate assembly protein W
MIIDDELRSVCEDAAVSCSLAWESRIDIADERLVAISRARHITSVSSWPHEHENLRFR